MKRILAVALACAAVVCLAVPALADGVGVRWVFKPFQFRTYAAAYNAPGYRDSATMSRLGVITGTTLVSNVMDTTTAIFIGDAAVVGAGADSAVAARVAFWDVGITGTADTLYAQIQMSMDGITWTPSIGAADAAGSIIGLSVAGADTKLFTRLFCTSNGPRVTPQIPNIHEIFAAGWQYVRCILYPDMSAAAVFNVRGGISYPVLSDQPGGTQ